MSLETARKEALETLSDLKKGIKTVSDRSNVLIDKSVARINATDASEEDIEDALTVMVARLPKVLEGVN